MNEHTYLSNTRSVQILVVDVYENVKRDQVKERRLDCGLTSQVTPFKIQMGRICGVERIDRQTTYVQRLRMAWRD